MLMELAVFLGVILEPAVVVLFGFLVALYLFVSRRNREGAFFAIVLIVAGLAIKVLKEFFRKARPAGMLVNETGYAFPSGHAVISVVFFGSLAYLLARNRSKEFKIWASVIAAVLVIAVSLSRIYLRVHDPIDVIGGLFLGGIILISGILVLKK